MSELLKCLVAIASAESATAYLEAQDTTIAASATGYPELLAIAETHENEEIRFEALGMVALLERLEAEAYLVERSSIEKSPRLAHFAEALAYRLIVAKQVRLSGKMTEAAYAKYQETVRVMSANGLFGA